MCIAQIGYLYIRMEMFDDSSHTPRFFAVNRSIDRAIDRTNYIIFENTRMHTLTHTNPTDWLVYSEYVFIYV